MKYPRDGHSDCSHVTACDHPNEIKRILSDYVDRVARQEKVEAAKK